MNRKFTEVTFAVSTLVFPVINHGQFDALSLQENQTSAESIRIGFDLIKLEHDYPLLTIRETEAERRKRVVDSMRALRNRAISAGMKLLTIDEINAMLSEIRGSSPA